MSIHIFANFCTFMGTAANNRGENEGNTSTLQKLIWEGQTHTTVSAESIRFKLRRLLADTETTNRNYDEEKRQNTWKDFAFDQWAKGDGFIDDDLLGFMATEEAKKENDKAEKGSAKVRRAQLEVTRAVSLLPWSGDVTFNAASPRATPGAAKKGKDDKIPNPVPYVVEMHATRYQYGIALTPASLRQPQRAAVALRALCALGEVAGNHARFLYDFSPESAIFRITHDPAPRLLYCFKQRGGDISFPDLLARVRSGDIKASELVIGGAIVATLSVGDRATLEGAILVDGVKRAAEEAIRLGVPA